MVTTPGFVRRGTLTSLLDGCKKENISVTIFSEIAPDPQIESVEQGFRLYQQIQAQAILAIGGSCHHRLYRRETIQIRRQ
ncbi:iron-containing alcohol dehydrogenase [Fusicatenibacter saccharivorans]|uniref:iron-containing alcohol dehydrogenase n=1 Tax=Fusicatenibacter saccharivorans TaxID=1150298 RepID=UPI003D7433AF